MDDPHLARWLGDAWIVPALAAAVRLSLFDLLDDVPRCGEELARAGELDPAALTTLLRALAAVRVVGEPAPDRFVTTPRLACLAREPLRSAALFAADARLGSAWGHLDEAVRAGSAAWKLAHGTDFFQTLDGDPTLRASFDRLQEAAEPLHAAVVAALDLNGIASVVDLGGGTGGLVRALHARAPHLELGLVERPALEGRVTLPDGARFVPADITRDPPPAADLYVLCHVVHDLDDTDAEAVLARAFDAASRGARLALVDALFEPPVPAPLRAQDLVLRALTGGRERGLSELEGLLARTGWSLRSVARVGGATALLRAEIV